MEGRFAATIINWYEKYGRELPWRNTTDPYKIWISEIILQQTRVAQGYDYYVRFIHRFPTVESLAGASLDEVLKYWQGLGYYSRARNLYAAAKQVAERGSFPKTYDEILTLKGVGDYTAAAIASFAFNQPVAVVDGNVYRVLARYFNIQVPIDSGRGKKDFRTIAQELLPRKDVSIYNQAIMDFGALQCTPKNPACSSCPLQDSCMGYAEKNYNNLPLKQHKTKVRERYFAYIYVRHNGKILLHKREGDDIWQGLYEIPVIESDKEICFQQLEAIDWIHAPLVLLKKNIRHQLSHQLLHVDLYLMDCEFPPSVEGEWVKESSREKYAVSRLMANLFAICDASS